MKKYGFRFFVCLLAVIMLSSCGVTQNSITPENNTGSNENGDVLQDPLDTDNGYVLQNIGDTSVFGNFIAKDINGNEITQDIFSQNKLTMVNIWATFCGPCISEMPYLGELSAEYADKGVGIVGIPVDITDEQGNVDDYLFNEALDIVATTNADYVHIVPTKSMFVNKLAAVITVPETIFVDSQGNQVGDSYFGARSKQQWAEIIDELLGEVQ